MAEGCILHETDSCCMEPTNASCCQLLHVTHQSLLQQIAANASRCMTQVPFAANAAGCRLHAAHPQIEFYETTKIGAGITHL